MDKKENSGIYVIEIYLAESQDITVGKLGTLTFSYGYYYYIGSAKKNLSQRVARHLKMRKKS
ncbi:MAG: DUF123 domain-containing protein, partial [Nitrospinae bacterium]|nr:DUF123 domain-containing protein [Nitrospinota bacterium]